MVVLLERFNIRSDASDRIFQTCGIKFLYHGIVIIFRSLGGRYRFFKLIEFILEVRYAYCRETVDRPLNTSTMDKFAQLGPFDGVLGFSQGGICYRYFHEITQSIDRQSYLDSSGKARFVLPKFFISCGSPVFPEMSFMYQN